MVSLRHSWPAVDWAKDGSFGGSQSKSAKWQIRKCGCGAVAMSDWMIYLTRYHGCSASSPVAEAAGRDPIPAELYDRVCCDLQRKCLPMVPPFGIAVDRTADLTALGCEKIDGIRLLSGGQLHPAGMAHRII